MKQQSLPKFTPERRNEVLTRMFAYIVYFAKKTHASAKVDIDDAVNEIFIRSAHRLDHCEDRGGPCIPLAKLIIRHAAFRMIRDMRALKRDIPNMDHAILESICADPASHETIRMVNRAREIADEMGGRIKDIFHRHYMMDEELKDIVVDMGVTPQAVSKHHIKLKNALQKEFV